MSLAIADRARSVNPAPPQGPHLRVMPILGRSFDRPVYRLLDADTLKSVAVTEISESGSVPELVVRNSLDIMVYLMDGQELRGAKQNRILNTDVLVPPASTLNIPVSCVEQGRWRSVSKTFVPGKSASHRTRASKAEQVRYSLVRKGKHESDQGAVWNDVEASLAAAAAVSPTNALSEAYAARTTDLNAFRASLTLPEDAVGLAVFHGEIFKGLDLFDRHSTLKVLWESIVDSYAVELLNPRTETAGEDGQTAERAMTAVRDVLARSAAGKWAQFPSPGLGEDWRLDDVQLAGSGLVCEETVVHLQLFPKQAQDDPEARPPRIRRRRYDMLP